MKEKKSINVEMMTTLRRICEVLSISADRIIFGKLGTQDTNQISERLERLSPRQFEIAETMLNCLLESFNLDNDHR